MRCGVFLLSAALALVSADAFAGVVVSSTSTNLDTKQARPSVAYVDADKLKVVMADTIVIFRGDQNKLWTITPSQNTYMEMTPDTVRQLQGRMAASRTQLEAAQARMQQQMANMPPAQRAQMEAMMARAGVGAGIAAGRGGPAAQTGTLPQIAYAKAGASKTVSSIRCDAYNRTNAGTRDEDICIAPLSSARLNVADFQVLDKFEKFMEPVASTPGMPREDFMNWNAMNQAIGFQGIPLDTVHYENGVPKRQDTVQKIERSNLPANTFDLPPGLTKRDFPLAPPPR